MLGPAHHPASGGPPCCSTSSRATVRADCPYGQGGSRSLHDASVAGVEVKGIYGAFTEHVIFLIVEADDIDALHPFLAPGMRTCTTRIRPVSEHAMPHPSS